MKTTLEEQFGLEAASVMERQSAMLFKARSEVCELHIALEEERKKNEQFSLQQDEIKNLKLCFSYAMKMCNYLCEKGELSVSDEEIIKNIGACPENFMRLKYELNI